MLAELEDAARGRQASTPRRARSDRGHGGAERRRRPDPRRCRRPAPASARSTAHPMWCSPQRARTAAAHRSRGLISNDDRSRRSTARSIRSRTPSSAERAHARGSGEGNAAADAQVLARRQSAGPGRAHRARRDRTRLARTSRNFSCHSGRAARPGPASACIARSTGPALRAWNDHESCRLDAGEHRDGRSRLTPPQARATRADPASQAAITNTGSVKRSNTAPLTATPSVCPR